MRLKARYPVHACTATTEFVMDMFDSPYCGAVLGKPMAKVELRNVKRGKIAGRIITNVFHNSKDVASSILESGHARSYFGDTHAGLSDED